MATKSFAVNTTPHVAQVGEVMLSFVPEANGSDLVEGYAKLRAAQAGVNLEESPESAKDLFRALRTFLAGLMLPESATLLMTLDVVSEDGEALGSFLDPAEAEKEAAKYRAAKVVDRLPLPSRVLTELMEWVIEVLAGSARPTGPSSDS